MPSVPPVDVASRARSSLTTSTYVQLDPWVLNTSKPAVIAKKKNRDESGFYTWHPAESCFFTIIKSKGETLLYCHLTDTVYYTVPDIWLSPAIPDQTAFLCQWCEDKGPQGAVPRLLVMDLVGTNETDVMARGQRLRDLSVHLPPSTYVLQWSGHLEALKQFVASLPHPVDFLMRLGEDPCLLEQQLTLNLTRKAQ